MLAERWIRVDFGMTLIEELREIIVGIIGSIDDDT